MLMLCQTIYQYMKRIKKTEALNIKVSKDVKDQLQLIAFSRDISIGQVVREAIVNSEKNRKEQV